MEHDDNLSIYDKNIKDDYLPDDCIWNWRPKCSNYNYNFNNY